MKALFVIQGEGRGHLTQALALERILRENGHEVVGMLVGKSKTRELPRFFLDKAHAPVRQFRSPNFQPSKDNRRIGLMRSAAYNIHRTPKYLASIAFLYRSIEESGADVVVNFYEVLCGLTYGLMRPHVPEVCIGHQYLFLHPDFHFPASHRLSQRWMVAFTRITCLGARRKLALALRNYPSDEAHRLTVVPPLLRPEIAQTVRRRGDFITGYILNAGFSDYVMEWHKAHQSVSLHFFWDKKGAEKVTRIDDTLSFHLIDDTSFIHYLANCRAYATTGGFESICEALYFGKPALMVPAHVEQECNAHDAEREGVGIVDEHFSMDRLLDFAHGYTEDVEFRMWANLASQKVVAALEDASEAARGYEKARFFPIMYQGWDKLRTLSQSFFGK